MELENFEEKKKYLTPDYFRVENYGMSNRQGYKTDVYALGVLVYRLIFNDYPFLFEDIPEEHKNNKIKVMEYIKRKLTTDLNLDNKPISGDLKKFLKSKVYT